MTFSFTPDTELSPMATENDSIVGEVVPASEVPANVVIPTVTSAAPVDVSPANPVVPPTETDLPVLASDSTEEASTPGHPSVANQVQVEVQITPSADEASEVQQLKEATRRLLHILNSTNRDRCHRVRGMWAAYDIWVTNVGHLFA